MLVCFTVAFIVNMSTLDFNRLKSLLVQVVKQETGRNLEIRGVIDIKLGLRPSLVVNDVLLQNAQGGAPEMIKIKRLEAKFLVLPLLNKEFQIDRLRLLEPDVLIEKHKSGRWNFEFEKPGEPGRSAAPSGSFTLARLGFHRPRRRKAFQEH